MLQKRKEIGVKQMYSHLHNNIIDKDTHPHIHTYIKAGVCPEIYFSR